MFISETMYHLNHTQIRLKVQWLSTPGDRTKIDDIYADKNKSMCYFS